MIINRYKYIHQLVTHRAKELPEKVAVVDKNKRITYQQLDQQSDDFCQYLTKESIGPGDLVALCIRKKPSELISCILGILKSGAAYVPINTALPKSLKNDIIKTVKPRLLISDKEEQQTAKLPALHIQKLPQQDQEEQKSLTGKNIAYVMYTSGTTGKPKGVAISHSNLLATYKSWAQVYTLKTSDNHLQMADLAFDVFTGDWIRALCSGATLVLCEKECLCHPDKLLKLIYEEKITVAEFVPAVLRLLNKIANQDKRKLSPFRVLICGSDLWTIGEYKQTKALCQPKTRIFNSYGLTETTIDSTFFELSDAQESQFKDSDIVPIGKPFPHVSVLILDDNLNPVPQGVLGEIYIGGCGVSEIGYLHQNSLTSNRFITLGEAHNNMRVYKTGDQAKLTTDGTLIFHGRNTLQTNINGKRVDILAVEAALTEFENIAQAIVIAKRKNEKVQLHAFLLTSDPVYKNQLIKFLKERLPDYCIPHYYHLVDKVPLTRQNKVDRTFESFKPQCYLPDSFTKAQSPLEQSIAKIWQDCTNNLSDICMKTPLNQLGGTSLTHMRMLSKINQRYGTSITRKTNCSTIEATASEVKKQHAAMKTHPPQQKIAIIGGGPAAVSFCNQLVHQLIERTEKNLEITVFEKSSSIGLGVPYKHTQEDAYILNLPIDMMALSGDEKNQFENWVTHNYPHKGPSRFPPRHVFGQYIAHTAEELCFIAKGHGINLQFKTNTEIIAVEPLKSHNRYQVSSKKESFEADHVIFCIGHMPSCNYRQFIGKSGYHHNPWSNKGYEQIDSDQPVAVLGSRISAIDVVMKLKSSGHTGKISLFSRDGLLPSVLSNSVPAYPLQYLTLNNINQYKSTNGQLPLKVLINLFWKEVSQAENKTVTFEQIIDSHKHYSALERLQKEIHQAERGARPWQQVLFSLYPIIPHIWPSLSTQDQQVFMQKYHSVFLTYLAAFPLDNAYQLKKLIESGEVEVYGSLKSVTNKNGHFYITTQNTVSRSNHLFNATGPGYNASQYTLFQSMENQGLLKPHPCGGIAVNTNNHLVKTHDGQESFGLYAIGELTRGNFWATTDMSQVNTQCNKVVPHLVDQIEATRIRAARACSLKAQEPFRSVAALAALP